ncbi:MAG: S-layer family protein, partial [Coleofasciculus sp. S288]|nr:S-layer family protein [Coleofasciculus sp. S288]
AEASTATLGEGDGGRLIVNATDSVSISGISENGKLNGRLVSTTDGSGDAGNVSVNTSRLVVQDGGQLLATTFSSGKGGSLEINASESVEVSGGAGNFFSELNAGSLPSPITGEVATGNSGDLTLSTGRLTILNGAKVAVSTLGSGSAGSLEVVASEVEIVGQGSAGGLSSPSILSARTLGSGSAGDVSITADQVTIQDGAEASVSSTGTSRAGDLNVNADTISLSNRARLTAVTEAGSGANIRLQVTDTLQLARESEISASTQAGQGGSITINASNDRATDVVTLSDRSQISAAAEQGGSAGDLTVTAEQLTVQEGAQVTVSSPQGQAGNLTITANTLTLNQGTLFAETGISSADSGANITLQDLDLLLLSNESLVSATAFEDANGGNVAIDSTLIVALPPQGPQGSDIIANAERGNGGRVSITTQGLFDIQFRPNRTPDNDITVSSTFGIAGEFLLTQPDVDPSRGLTALPTDLANATELIDRSCAPGGRVRMSRFTVTGRGGFPPNPIEPLDQESLLEDFGTPVIVDPATVDSEKQATNSDSNSRPTEIVEAQGWVRNSDGKITLVALVPAVTPKSFWLTSLSCHKVQATITGVTH